MNSNIKRSKYCFSSFFFNRYARNIRKLGDRQTESNSEVAVEGSTETALALPQHIDITYKKNPFEAVGLLPSTVKDMTSDDIRSYVKALSKALMEICHPDQGGNAVRFKEISEAVSILENPTNFETARQQYIKYE